MDGPRLDPQRPSFENASKHAVTCASYTHTKIEHAAMTTTSTQSNSRRSAPIVSTADVLEIYRLDTDPRAVVETGPPALVVYRILATDDTLPAVEVRGAAKTLQAHIEF